jgi:phosphoribosyl 1,2-cyclic phosphate phosphodiesterase
MKVTFLGTGYSVGIPTVGCDCETCVSDGPRDKRLRTPVLIQYDNRNLFIDTSIDIKTY